MPPLSPGDAVELVNDRLFKLLRHERERLKRLDLWYRWQHEQPVIPRNVTREHRYLLELIKTPWLGLVVTNVAQQMYVDGYRSPTQEQTDPNGPWRTWQGNDLDNRQTAIHRGALAYGQSFATVLPGVGHDDKPMSVIRGVSPRKMVAVYQDPAEDDWPMYALRGDIVGGTKEWTLRLYDDEFVYYMAADSSATNVKFIESRAHGAGVCPVVRYANMLDLDGRTDGEVEPFIPTAARINKTVFDRLLTQHFGSWKVRTVSGMAAPDEEEAANRKKLQLRQDDVLIAEDADTKFGQLDESPLTGYIEAHKSDIETLAAVSQTPSHNLTGAMVNLSAEALAAAEASLSRKVTERKKSFGKSHDQALRLAAALEGNNPAATDVMAHVTWADMESRSLAQAVDALGKAATMLGIPAEALWSRIPGVTATDVAEWSAMAKRGDSVAELADILSGKVDPSAGAGGPGSG